MTGTGATTAVMVGAKTVTTGRWKVSLVQDHENVAVNGVVVVA